MKLGWENRANNGKNQDGSRVGMATVVALVWPFPVWVCDGNQWQREAWGMVAAWGVSGGMNRWTAAWAFFSLCLFHLSVSPLFSFLFFSFVFGFRLFRLFLLLGFHFSYWRGATYWRIEKKVAVQREKVRVAIHGEEKVKSKVLPPNGKRNAYVLSLAFI